MDQELAIQKVKQYEAARTDAQKWHDLYVERRNAILAYVQDDLAALDAEMKPYLDQTDEILNVSEAAAKIAVLELGQTVKGDSAMFVWAKGKTTWDGGKLEGMASIVPALNDAKKVGQPSVSIRQAG